MTVSRRIRCMKSQVGTNKSSTCKGPGAGRSHVTAGSEYRKGAYAKVLGQEGAMLPQSQDLGWEGAMLLQSQDLGWEEAMLLKDQSSGRATERAV